jgi:hypothetical protein
MKHILITAIWLLLPALTVCFVSSCVQLIDRRQDGSELKINSIFSSTSFDGLYRDPDGFLEVGKYKGIPSDIEIQYNPYTGVKLKTEKGD